MSERRELDDEGKALVEAWLRALLRGEDGEAELAELKAYGKRRIRE